MTDADHSHGLWPLLGRNRRHARVTLAVVVALCVSVVVADLVPELLLTSDQQPRLLWVFNGIAGAILIVVVLTPILAIAYGLWNRGPLLSFAIPVAPALTATLLSGRFLLTTDLALAVSAGAVATVLGTCRLFLDVSRGPSGVTPVSTVLQICLGLSTFSVVLAGGVFRAVSRGAGPHMSFGVTASAVLFAVSVVSLLGVVFIVLWPERAVHPTG